MNEVVETNGPRGTRKTSVGFDTYFCGLYTTNHIWYLEEKNNFLEADI